MGDSCKNEPVSPVHSWVHPCVFCPWTSILFVLSTTYTLSIESEYQYERRIPAIKLAMTTPVKSPLERLGGFFVLVARGEKVAEAVAGTAFADVVVPMLKKLLVEEAEDRVA